MNNSITSKMNTNFFDYDKFYKTDNISDCYPFVVNEVINYIVNRKQTEKNLSLVDIISDFCQKKSMNIELVGDAIASDVYLKSFIEKDCEYHNNLNKSNNEW